MTCLFVHGVPDTVRLWDKTLARINRADVRALSMPGFGAGVPDGFACTMDAYAGWLIGEMEAEAEPVDLVGHDWGGLLVQRAACLRPDLVRSWAAGGVAIDEAYVWHDTARIWQTPGEGEAFMEAMGGDLTIAALTEWRVPAEDAAVAAAHADDVMKAAILSLYRSAVDIGAEWSPALSRIAPEGLVLWGEHDPFASVEVGRRFAERTGARFHLFADCGHWWPVERPDETARQLEQHWSRL